MEDPVEKATEAQLRDFDRSGTITSARVVRTEDGYVLVVRVSWKKGDVVIYNHRNKPRAWVSLDRMIGHLNEVAPTIDSFKLILRGVVPDLTRD